MLFCALSVENWAFSAKHMSPPGKDGQSKCIAKNTEFYFEHSKLKIGSPKGNFESSHSLTDVLPI